VLHLVHPQPDLRERVWGGTRLGSARMLPIGEAWLAGPWNVVAEGPDAGLTLDQLAAREGVALVGRRGAELMGDRFPLLVKLIDSTEWLSVQVHPDDELARRLEGPDAVGKAEAWYVLDVAPGAELLLGLAPGVSPEALRDSIIAAPASAIPRVAPLLRRVVPRPGGAHLVPAGTLHAIGPGIFVYEIQQPSDITYRCEDWGRPATAARQLHTNQSLASVALGGQPVDIRPSAEARTVPIQSAQFRMERILLGPDAPLRLEPAGATLHVVTALAPIRLRSLEPSAESTVLDTYQTVVVPAEWPAYEISAARPATVLVASLP
jgi:mannose-6-phosphate isomerase